MVDPKTAAYLRELNKSIEEANRKAIAAAEEICQCTKCVLERGMRKSIQEDKNKVLESLPGKMIVRADYSVLSELSSNPNYWKLGRRG